MNFFLTKAERIKYIGFDDHYAAIIGVPLVGFLAFLLFSSGQEDIAGREAMACFGMGLIHTIFYWLINRFWVIRTRFWFPKETDTAKRILLIIGFALASVIAFELVSSYLIGNFLPFMREAGWGDESFLFKISTTYTLCLMVLGMYEGAYFFMKYREGQVEREQLAKENMQTQLAVLKQQMNPHFLFNSLNTLVNVIPEDSEKAMLFTQRLAAVYRRILEYRHKELITLEEELVALKDYIFLMQTRFEEKLIVVWGMSDRTMSTYKADTPVPTEDEEQCEKPKKEPLVPPHLRHHMIVPLSVQLLVENAIKHNVISSESPLELEIILDDAAVTVRNQLHLRDRKLNSTGWGHHNLQQRYQSLTGQSITIRQTETEYEVSLPVISGRVAARAAVG